MIVLTRLNGGPFALAVPTIERVESSPDTTVHTTTGRTYLVAETVEQVIAAVVEHEIAVRAGALARAGATPGAT